MFDVGVFLHFYWLSSGLRSPGLVVEYVRVKHLITVEKGKASNRLRKFHQRSAWDQIYIWGWWWSSSMSLQGRSQLSWKGHVSQRKFLMTACKSHACPQDRGKKRIQETASWSDSTLYLERLSSRKPESGTLMKSFMTSHNPIHEWLWTTSMI